MGTQSAVVDAVARTLLADSNNTVTINAATTESGSGDTTSVVVPAALTGTERYEVLGTIGEGGMGRVLLARDLQFGRSVALKEMHAELLSAQALRRFLIESLVTGNLEHPGIASVYERGIRDGRPFYTMRRLEGHTLAEVLSTAKDLTARLKLLPALVKIAQAVGFAHERGVVHRDLKPDNVLVGAHGEVVVIDWGLAKVRSLEKIVPDQTDAAKQPTKEGATAHGSVLGTPAYMAPEQALGLIDEVDERTDVFALGAILYQLLTGHAPYAANNALAVLALAADGNVSPIADRQVPTALRSVCEKALHKNQSLRYANATEFGAALENVVHQAVIGKNFSAVTVLITGVLLSVAVAIAIAGVYAMLQASSFAEQGWPIKATVIMALLGITLSIIEAATRGRYQLSTMALLVAVITMLEGLAGTVVGCSMLLKAMNTPRILEDSVRFRMYLVVGGYELLGLLVSTCVLAIIQFFVWGIVHRTQERRMAFERQQR